MEILDVEVKSILTRTGGYLSTVASHSAQPYRGCTYGRSLCGVGCYAQHNRWVTGGGRWGERLEIRTNAASAYRGQIAAERRWARRRFGTLTVFMSSSTDPFVPQERRAGVTAALLDAMIEDPPDALVVQTHTHRVLDARGRLATLAGRCALRVHVTVESDRDRLPGLPPPASPVARRLAAAGALRAEGIRTVITVAPLLPLKEPAAFFARVADCADAVVIDHFVGGDGSRDGARTRRTRLPLAMEAVHPGSAHLDYREAMIAIARRAMPGRVGVSADGFAGKMLP